MYKLRPSLFLFFFSALGILIMQSCSKSAVTGVALTTAAFQANINGNAWAPDTISTSITYNTASKTKTFSCTSTKNQKQVIFSITLFNASNTPGFTPGTYNITAGDTTTAQYNTWQQDQSGTYAFLPHGTVEPRAGSIVISSVDSVKKVITGTFNFYSRSTTTDNSGNLIINIDNITGGEFNSTPYTFTSN